MKCPDNLLIGYRRGTLSVEESARLDAHIAQCASCRLLLRAGQDLDEELSTMPGDDLIAARIAKNLAPRLATERKRSSMRVVFLIAAAIAILASAGLAAAASLGALPFLAQAPVQPAPTHREPAAPPSGPVPAPVPEPVPGGVLPEPVPIAEREPPAPSASDLFAQANTRRREGDPRRAQTLYRELQRRYPRSPEAEISYVSLGRVQLELGDTRDALEQFERYLAKQPRGPLAEEALFGKASALERLGRSADERRTWDALLAAYPSSVYADRARDRLERTR